jgi:SHS2 domain-containing protein
MADGARHTAFHSFDEPSDELRLRLEAASLDELFAEAGRALAELMLPSEQGRLDAGERITLEAADREALLVDWINELVFRAETEHRVFVDFRFERLTDRSLSACARGVDAGELRNEVKAATLHELCILEHDHGFSATVTLDV